MIELVKSHNRKMRADLDLIDKECQQTSYSINTGNLVPYNGKLSKDNCPEWKLLGSQFDKVQGPVVYWFELEKNIDATLVFRTAKEFKSATTSMLSEFRQLPAMKEVCPVNTNILYVGCCAKTKLKDRMLWHFGYYATGKTQGLQLCHWSRQLNLNLTIHVLSFPPQAQQLIYVYETLFAQQLKPLIGKH